MTQYDVVKNHLIKYKKINSWEAIQEYGITRLSQYIYLLRKEGYKIISETLTVKNRQGGKSYPVEYTLLHNTIKEGFDCFLKNMFRKGE